MWKINPDSKPDIKGKIRDIVELPELARMIYFDINQYPVVDDARLAALQALRQIGESNNTGIRLRDFVVLTGTMQNSLEENLFSLCLPEGISMAIVQFFFDALEPLCAWDYGVYPLNDLLLEPFARYINGKIIIYTDTTSPPEWLPPIFEPIKFWGIEWETRSAYLETVIKSPAHRPLYHSIPESNLTEKPPGERHTFEDHARLSATLDKIVFPWSSKKLDMLRNSPPFGYKQLRDLCIHHLGITIQEDDLEGISGILHVGRPYIDEMGIISARVNIRIDYSLPTDTKYVVLAHELAHYRLHFPWLLASSLAFHLSLRAPETVVILSNLLKKQEAIGQKLEHQADIYSSYFLLHRLYDGFDKAPEILSINYRRPMVQELIWHELIPFFPDDSVVPFSWRQYKFRSHRATTSWLRLAFGAPPAILLERYFAAVLERIQFKDMQTLLGHDTADDAFELINLLNTLAAESPDLRANMREFIDARVKSEEWQQPASIEEFIASFQEITQAYLGLSPKTSLEVVLPKNIGTPPICPVTVLVPLSQNTKEKRFVALPGMSPISAATREEWIERLPYQGLVIADLSQKTLEALKRDSFDVPSLGLIPTAWNLEMKPDGDWYGAAILQFGKYVEFSRPHMADTVKKWAIFCTERGLRLTFEKLSKSQVEDLQRLKLVNPDLAWQILDQAKNAQEIEVMLTQVKAVLSLDVLPWEKEDYFEGSTNADDYAMRILSDCIEGGLFDGHFWTTMFQAEKILKKHKLQSAIQQETLELIREALVDNELCGSFDPWFKCDSCGKEFMPILNQEYVQSTLSLKKFLCRKCNSYCTEHKYEDASG